MESATPLFTAKGGYNRRELVRAVRAVALFVDPEDPELLTQPQFDRAKANVGHEGAPLAKSIRARLDMSWRELVDYALSSEAESQISLGRRRGERNADELTEADCVDALQTVAFMLGDAPTVNPERYDEGRAEFLRADQKRYKHGGRLALPNANQVKHVFGGEWAAALAAAGLRVEVEAFTVVQVIDRFIGETGQVPTWENLVAYRRARGLRMTRDGFTSYPAALAEVRRTRAEAGNETPLTAPPLAEQILFTRAPKKKPRQNLTEADCVEGIIVYLDWLAADATRGEPTQKSYGRFSRSHDVPVPSCFNRKNRPGWTVLLKRAERERLKRRRARS